MKLLFILLLTISLVFTQSTTDPTLVCKDPCYGSNVSPCANPDSICGRSTSATVKAGCENICYPPGATDADKLKLSDSCAACTVKSVCTTGQQCVYKDTAKCYNCDCQKVNCLADPCGATNECAKKLGASCVSNYCGGCNAEYYLNGRRVCTNANVTCPVCTRACPSGTIQKYTDDGCDVCDGCTSVCPVAYCALNCPNGKEVDTNGCEKCQCKACPAVSCAANCVNGYFVDPYSKCQTCTCNNCSTCPTLAANCPNGYEIDPKTGCKTCNCATCQAVDCATVKCANGFLLTPNGCPSCNCKPDCLRYCPDGYKYDATNVQTCDCACSPVNCLLACANYAVDANGCKTCSCIKPYDTCTKPACATPCDYGYVTENGCLTCKCEAKPVCPALLCAVKCAYGTLFENGCPTCNCEPCPAVTCPRYCPYGFVKRLTTGCPECVCAQKDVCPNGGVSGDTKTSPTICPLSCTNGYELDTSNGCPSCKCLPAPKCTCPAKSTEQIKCADGNVYDKYSDYCRADASNVCSYVERKCPIAIEIKLAAGVSLSDAEKAIIVSDVKTNFSIPDPDVKTVEKVNADGTKSFIVYISTDTVPSNKTPTDIKDQTSTSFKSTGKQGEAFLIESNAQNSFGTMLLVPILGFIAMLL